MAHRRSYQWRRLFCAVLFTGGAAFLAGAQEDEREPLKALVEVSSGVLSENKAFSLIILVNHPRPGEVSIKPPEFHDEFYLERLRGSAHLAKSGLDTRQTPPRAGERAADRNRWTELELVIVPVKQGTFTLGSFTISTPYDTINTLPLQLTVEAAEEADAVPYLFWTGTPPVRVGEAAIATLKMSGLGRGQKYPRSLPLAAAAPKNAIIEQLPIPEPEQRGGAILKLKVLPLEGREVELSEYRIRYQNTNLRVPGLTIKVSAAPPAAAPEIPGKGDGAEGVPFSFTPERRLPHELPEAATPPRLFSFLDGAAYQSLLDGARERWRSGDYAAALARLRAGERDLLCGPYFAGLRKNAEARLGLGLTAGEHWRPSRLFLLLGGINALYLLALSGRALFRRFYRAAPCRFPVKRLLAAALIVLFAAGGFAGGRARRGQSAVLHSGPAYEVPEVSPREAVFFNEGTPVSIRTRGGAWLYAEAENGDQGWIQREQAVLY
jgi:hypothetical protein